MSKKKYDPVYKVKNNKVMKKEYPPLSPLALKIKKILENEIDDYEGRRRVTGVTVSAVKIEKMFNKMVKEEFPNPSISSELNK